MSLAETLDDKSGRERLAQAFGDARDATMALAEPLSPEDQVVQSMTDVSPTKWHLAHVTWFWETFLLQPEAAGYAVFDGDYNYLFNSYYEQVGARHARPERGLLTRPPLDDIHAYRRHVDAAMARWLESVPSADLDRLAPLIELGIAHEQQHQELLLMDIKHVLSRNPCCPAAYPRREAASPAPGPARWVGFEGGLVEIGAEEADGFTFDNERPRHKVWLEPYDLADRPVTNGDYAEFIADGGYETATLWLSDGWTWVRETGARAPLYWREDGLFTLHGLEPADPNAPVCHLTLYEADAYAEWAGARLPTEAEWEAAAAAFDPVEGDYADPGRSAHPQPVAAGEGLRGLSGGVWEWTRSAYSPYPGFRPLPGAAGEYNGKFMCGQYVMRGGCCATPRGHARRTYRNFFYPRMAWQFGGLRLARDN